MGRLCILRRMKAWQLLLLGIGACAEPARRPPTTYVAIARGPDNASALPPGPLEPAAAPLGQDPSSTSAPVPVSSKAASNDKDKDKNDKGAIGNDPANDEKCFKKGKGDCCTEQGFKAKRTGTVAVCPAGMILGAKCKGFGRSCRP